NVGPCHRELPAASACAAPSVTGLAAFAVVHIAAIRTRIKRSPAARFRGRHAAKTVPLAAAACAAPPESCMFTTAGVFPGIDIPAAITRADLPLTLMSARGMDALADAVATAAKSLEGCREACVLWSLSWPGERQLRPQRALSTDRLALADQAVSSAGVVHSRNGEDIAVPLSVG